MNTTRTFLFILAIIVVGVTFNAQFDILEIPRRNGLMIGVSGGLFLLLLVQIYHDRLMTSMMRRALSTDPIESIELNERAGKDRAFYRGIAAFLLFIPSIPAMVVFPDAIYFGGALFLVSLHGAIKTVRAVKGEKFQFHILQDRILYTLGTPVVIHKNELKRIEKRYEHLYFILNNDKVRTFPMEYLPENRTDEVLNTLSKTAEGWRKFIGRELKEQVQKGSLER